MEKPALYNHIEDKHPNAIPEGTSVSQLYFNLRNNKTQGSCVICGGETEWNEATERYERFDKESCREKYREEFKQRMLDKYGKVHLLNSPEQQKKMLKNRSISGVYLWSDGRTRTEYTGSYELDFLKFLDIFLNMNPTDVMAPAPQVFYYNDEDGTKRFYIPDFYIASINTLVEVKDGGDNPNNHHNRQNIDGRKEKLKDEIMRNQKQYNFVKVTNKNYSIFLKFLMDVKNHYVDAEKQEGFPIISISETVDMIQEKILGEIGVAGVAAIAGPNASPAQNNPYLHDDDELDELVNETNPLKAHDTFERINYAFDWMDAEVEPKRSAKEIAGQVEQIDGQIQDIDRDTDSKKSTKKDAISKIKGIQSDDGSMNDPEDHLKFKNEQTISYGGKTDKLNAHKSYKDIYRGDKWLTARNDIDEESRDETTKKIIAVRNNERLVDSDEFRLSEAEANYDGMNNVERPDPKVSQIKEIDELLNNARKIWIGTDYHLFNNHDDKPKNADEKLLKNQIDMVGDNDVFIYLGDLVDDTWTDKLKMRKAFRSLRGRKILILGNNDIFDEQTYRDCGFEYILESFRYKNILFSHFPVELNGTGAEMNIHGHLHWSQDYFEYPYSNHADVYSIHFDCKPVELIDVLNKLNAGYFVPKVRHDRPSKLSENTISSVAPLFVSGASNNLALIPRSPIAEKLKANNKLYRVGDKWAYKSSDLNHTDLMGIRDDIVKNNDNGNIIELSDVDIRDSDLVVESYVPNGISLQDIERMWLESPIVGLGEDYADLLTENFKIDADGSMLINLREKSDFMSKYNTSHKLMKIYMQTGNTEGAKHELCKLWYMYIIIENYYAHPTRKMIFPKSKQQEQDALKAKAFILNDFTTGLRWLLEKEPGFNFDAYFQDTEYNKDVIKLDTEQIKGIKKFINALLV